MILIQQLLQRFIDKFQNPLSLLLFLIGAFFIFLAISIGITVSGHQLTPDPSFRGVTLLLGVASCISSIWLYYHPPRGYTTANQSTQSISNSTPGKVKNLPSLFQYEQISTKISQTIEKLEKNDYELVKYYQASQNLERLLDGLYSSLLYASSSILTGRIELYLYGNLMEWDSKEKALRVRYFKGAYNDEIITRSFPIKGPDQGVASKALKSNHIQIVNDMREQIMVAGEWLPAMLSIPIPETNWDNPHYISRQIVILNIDSGISNIFPESSMSPNYDTLKQRSLELAYLIARVNKMYRKFLDK